MTTKHRITLVEALTDQGIDFETATKVVVNATEFGFDGYKALAYNLTDSLSDYDMTWAEAETVAEKASQAFREVFYFPVYTAYLYSNSYQFARIRKTDVVKLVLAVKALLRANGEKHPKKEIWAEIKTQSGNEFARYIYENGVIRSTLP